MFSCSTLIYLLHACFHNYWTLCLCSYVVFYGGDLVFTCWTLVLLFNISCLLLLITHLFVSIDGCVCACIVF